MKYVFMCKYSRKGASSRYRSYQYKEHFEAAGMSVIYSPLFTDFYLRIRYRYNVLSKILSLLYYARRIIFLMSLEKNCFLIVEKELFPYLPAMIEMYFLRRFKGYSLDFDDALFHLYDSNSSFSLTSLLSKKYEIIVNNAHLVTVGNSYIKNSLIKFNSKIEYLPTVLDTDLCRNQAAKDSHRNTMADSNRFTIGWIGTPFTAQYLSQIQSVLEEFLESTSSDLVLIGGDIEMTLRNGNKYHFNWSEENEYSLLSEISVGIMPLPDMPVERGKSGLKLLQYMCIGKPVIASPVGVNKKLVREDTGLLASSKEEWLEALRIAHSNHFSDLGKFDGGKTMVDSSFSLEIWGPRYCQLLNQL